MHWKEAQVVTELRQGGNEVYIADLSAGQKEDLCLLDANTLMCQIHCKKKNIWDDFWKRKHAKSREIKRWWFLQVLGNRKGGVRKHTEGVHVAKFVSGHTVAFIYSCVWSMNVFVITVHMMLTRARERTRCPAPLMRLPIVASVWRGESNMYIFLLSKILFQGNNVAWKLTVENVHICVWF